MIRQIVNRCHVSKSNRSVIRYLITCLRHGYATFHAMPRADRRKLMAEIIRVHAANRNLYSAVMGGSNARK